MKRLAAITFCAATAFAGTASIVASFKSPCSASVFGIDYYDNYLYHADNGIYIYKTDTIGSLVETLRMPIVSTDIDRIDSGFWTCNYNGYIYELSTTGSIRRYFSAPSRRGYGITYDGYYLWYSDSIYIYKLTTMGIVLKSFKPPAADIAGVCSDMPYLWLAGYSTYNIYQLTQSGSIADSFLIKQKAMGITWDTSYVWYAGEEWVYKMKANFTSIAPASLGRVKALYR